MKILKSFSLFILFIALLTSCETSKTKNLVVQNINKKWMLIEFGDFKKIDLIHHNAYIDLSKDPNRDQHFQAKMGCNSILFSADFSKNTVKISQLSSTEMFCQDKMDLENAFLKEFPTMNHYKIEGHFLILSNGKQQMKLVAEDWD